MIQSGGFTWDLYHNGQMFPVHYVPFVMFLKGDSKELDTHCGKYTSYRAEVKNNCRSCICPTSEFDDPLANHPRKSKKMILDLANAKELNQLKNLSQNNVFNSWYEIKLVSTTN